MNKHELLLIHPYFALVCAITAHLVPMILACKLRQMKGRGWLIACTSLWVVTVTGFRLIEFMARGSSDRQVYYKWFPVIDIIGMFALASFGMFMLAAWGHMRFGLSTKHLLFFLEGRIPRSVFWATCCILFPLGNMLGFAPFINDSKGPVLAIIWTVYVAWMLAGVWISICLYAKRWHDLGKSGWMSLILFIPLIGALWFLYAMGFQRGTPGPNQYGDDPLSPPAA